MFANNFKFGVKFFKNGVIGPKFSIHGQKVSCENLQTNILR